MNQIISTIDTYLALTVVLVNFVFATLIMFRTSRTVVYFIFFLICVSNIFWNFGDFMFYVSANRSWFYFSLIGSAMLPALMFHWIIILIKPEQKSTSWIIPAYIFSGLLAVSSPFAMLHTGIQWFVDSAIWNIVYLILLGPFLLVGTIMIFNGIKRTTSKNEKSRLCYILIAVIIGVSTGLTDLIQILRVPVPAVGHLGCLMYSFVLALGVYKHRTYYDIIAQMRMKLEVLNEISAGISHEIRNPLSSIKGAVRLLFDRLKENSNPEDIEYFTIITDEIERLNIILTNYQYFTKPLKIEKQLVFINEVIQKTVKLAEIDVSHIKIQLDLSEDVRMIQADEAPMQQVFLNFIKNAADACNQDGELIIKTEYFHPWVKISFSDNGTGIPPESLNRIFEPFFSTKTKGMGMGLSICQRIIQTHGGRIEVNNILPKGTRFSILLPI
jgi:signal transduction histidine kinase